MALKRLLRKSFREKGLRDSGSRDRLRYQINALSVLKAFIPLTVRRLLPTALALIATILTISAHGQGFLNMDFESAYDLPGNPPEPLGADIPTTNALPGWTAYSNGGAGYSDVYYVSNYVSGYSSPVELEGGSLALSGEFSVELFLDGSISQTGSVPASAESLQFEAEGRGAGGSLGASGFSVSLGGQTLSFSALSQGTGYTVYGANIPAGMDGQSEALAFVCQGVGSGQVILDNIEFSTMSVPEPGEWAMIGVGAVLVGVRCRRRRARVVD